MDDSIFFVNCYNEGKELLDEYIKIANLISIKINKKNDRLSLSFFLPETIIGNVLITLIVKARNQVSGDRNCLGIKRENYLKDKLSSSYNQHKLSRHFRASIAELIAFSLVSYNPLGMMLIAGAQ